MRKFPSLVILMFCILGRPSAQDLASLNIYLINELNEPVINAHITVNNKSHKVTNQYGFAGLKVTQGFLELVVSHTSYLPLSMNLEIESDTTLAIVLKNYTLDAIDIVSSKRKVISALEDINIENIKSLPGLTGTADIINNLRLLPGVSGTAEGNIGFSVRGGETYQNSILIDRALLLNPSHLFGFLSTVNSKVVNEVKLYKNHIPARFGNASSSVVDISVKNGNKDSLIYDLDLGITNSSIVVNGPLSKRITFLAGLRTAYLGVLTSPAYIQYHRGKVNAYSNYNFYDANLKIKYEITPSNKLTVHFFRNKDNILNLGRVPQESVSKRNYNWQNNALNISQYKQLKNGVFLTNYISFSNYNTTLRNQVESLSTSQLLDIDTQRKSIFSNINVKSQFSIPVRTSMIFRLGYQADYINFIPLSLQTKGSADNGSFLPIEFDLFSHAIYFDNDIDITSSLKLNYGLRASFFSSTNFKELILEPRAVLRKTLFKNDFIEFSYNRTAQNRIQFPLRNFGLPLEVNIPVNSEVSIPITEQYNLSYINNGLWGRKVNLSLSVYYKTMRGLTTLNKVVPFINSFDQTYSRYLASDGIGRAYGSEVSLNYNISSKFTLDVNYHISQSLRKYSELNQGDWFPHEFNRLHELSVLVNKVLSEKWSFFLNFTLNSGNPTTLPSDILRLGDDISLFVFDERNNYTLPTYHRADLAFTRMLSSKPSNSRMITFALYNAYFNRNVYDVVLQQDDETSTYTLRSLSVFPVIPSVNYSVRF